MIGGSVDALMTCAPGNGKEKNENDHPTVGNRPYGEQAKASCTKERNDCHSAPFDAVRTATPNYVLDGRQR